MTQVKFDATGVLSADGSTVSVGCQVVNMRDVLKAADKVEVENGEVRATGVKCDVDGRGWVTLPNGNSIGRPALAGYARNLSDVTPPAPAWQDGDIVVTTDKARLYGTTGGPRMRVGGEWVRPDGTRVRRQSDGITHPTVDQRIDADLAAGRYAVLIKGGKRAAAAGSRHMDSPLQPGERVRCISGSHVGKVGVITRGTYVDGATYAWVQFDGEGFDRDLYAERFVRI